MWHKFHIVLRYQSRLKLNVSIFGRGSDHIIIFFLVIYDPVNIYLDWTLRAYPLTISRLHHWIRCIVISSTSGNSMDWFLFPLKCLVLFSHVFISTNDTCESPKTHTSCRIFFGFFCSLQRVADSGVTEDPQTQRRGGGGTIIWGPCLSI